LFKRAELIKHKITQHIDFNRKWVSSFKKIVLRFFYIEYFSTFGGDFAPIVLRNAGLLVVWGTGGGTKDLNIKEDS
jgi:hypothetical protein